MLVDSPGLEDFSEEQQFISQIIEEADLILFVVDGKVALGEQDMIIRNMILQASKKKRTIVLVNKLDGKVYGRNSDLLIAEYYEM
jgi:predicted GTPase